MAKPDIQDARLDPAGNLFRVRGKEPLDRKGPVTGAALTARNFTSDINAAAGGVEIGEFYHTNGDLKIRRS